jgi:hypothetical protein
MGKKGKSQTNKQNSVLRSFARPQADGKLKNFEIFDDSCLGDTPI